MNPSVATFILGVLIGAGGLVFAQQQAPALGVFSAVNHVAVAVPHFEAALQYYETTLGLQRAFTSRDENANAVGAYFQVSRETFIEVQPVTATHPAGVNHIGMEVADIDATVRLLRQRGLTVSDPQVGRSRARLANTTLPGGVRIELMQLGSDSLQRQAMESWRSR